MNESNFQEVNSHYAFIMSQGNKRYVPTENELGCNDDVDDNHNNNTNHNNTNGVDFSDIDKVSKTDSLGLDHESPNGDGKEGYFENAEGSQQIRQDVNNEKQRRQQGTNHPSSFDSMQRGGHPNTESAAVEDHIDVNATNSAEIDGRHYAAAGVSVGEKNSYNNGGVGVGGGGHSKRVGTSTSTSNFMGSFTGMFSPSTSSIGKQPPNSQRHASDMRHWVGMSQYVVQYLYLHTYTRNMTVIM